MSGAPQEQKLSGAKWTEIKAVNDRAPKSPVAALKAAASTRRAQICLAIVLTVTAAQPTFCAAKPQNQEQHGTGLSQAETKSIVTSDPCSSFHAALSKDVLARPDESGKSQAGVKVSISPQTDTRLAVGYSLRLAATVTGTTNTAVEWAVAGPGCSGPACGSIEGDVYLAPTTVPTPPVVRLTATSKADSRASNSTIVCIVQPERRWRHLSAAKSINAAVRDAARENNRNNAADLKPYVELLHMKVQEEWYKHVPQSARGPELKQGNVTVEFLIERSGRITDAAIASTSGDKDLDNAALTAIHNAKLPPFPSTIRGNHLSLRFNFAYNPSSNFSKIGE